jgi:hypothetical protein
VIIMTKRIECRSPTPLENLDVKVLLEHIKPFLETCRLTPDSDTYLRFHPKLQAVIDKL